MKQELIRRIIKRYGTPLFIYDNDIMEKQCKKLQTMITDRAQLYYSMKANPTLGICQVISRLIKHVEVSSLGELYGAFRAGVPADKILFSGPVKGWKELEEAVKHRVRINVESVEEVRRLNEICIQKQSTADILVRINPDFNYLNKSIVMTGISSQFGMEPDDLSELLEIRKQRYVRLLGLSVYLGSQVLDADTILRNCEAILKLAINLSRNYHFELKLLDFGGGFGISYFDQRELDAADLQRGLAELFKRYDDQLRDTGLIFESGRYLTADSGIYVTKVIDKKISKGKNYILCDGGLNHILGSSYYNRELRDNYPIEVLGKSGPGEEYYIAGPLCTPKDVFGRKALITNPEIGDYICVRKVGAYGLSFSPIRFISRPAPAEVLLRKDSYALLRKRETYSELFANQLLLPQ